MVEAEANATGDMTVAQYLSVNEIEVIPSDHDRASALGVHAPIPAGWQAAPIEQFPGATDVLVEPGLVQNGFAPNAVLLVGRLSSTVDPRSLLNCCFTDARLLPGWSEGDADVENFGGWPSRFIRGTFEAEQLALAVTTRYVVIGTDEQHLVQLTVTILADQMDRLAFDVAAINDGLLGGIF
ncbi:LpqN/LpqT family lipoprotein [Rhodococcus sp. G-MC3]|uniref:LpqN/LpqT family lipoprotein n=1 Tax=Rhodococcus sp. G-MC3 TaxID=3046209 RepID=UPI0024BAF931|nr:LpqN/LpqT family lipoprotein [Rhodococcus sp. G-MC3]MDJ0396300.1 LpqN/LpqT family lipoprotein [Rhodococcus sp. G-MC3]